MFKRTQFSMSLHGLVLITAALALTPWPAWAQQSNDAENVLEEILVTGTLIRGVQPTGSQVIGIDAEAILDSGATTTNELLSTIPQVANFFNQRPEQDPRGADRLTINRPNLRNLPGINEASGATTLILVDGHRITPIGVAQSSVDPDIIPSRVMERVEIVTDGGSSLYGTDAVGGVINFITKKEFDGVELDLSVGSGEEYSDWSGSLTAGTKWDNGSAYISYTHTDRNGVINGDRDFALEGVWDPEGTVLSPANTECPNPVGAITTWFWFGAGWTTNPAAPGAGVEAVGTPCDLSASQSFLPDQERDSIYAAFNWEFSDTVTLETKTYFMNRTTTYDEPPLGDTVSGLSPVELGLIGNAVGDLFPVAAVGFSYGAHPEFVQRERFVELQTWGITPELTIELGNNWRLRNTAHFGHSYAQQVNPGSNQIELDAAVATGTIDAGNIASTDIAVINRILDFENAGETKQQLTFLRSIADGELVDMPAGPLRVAVGIEVSRDEAERRSGDVVIGGLANIPFAEASRNVNSVFAEFSVPILENLELSLSARYDDYSDFGNTTNPNIGFTFTPTDWLKIYGKWGESFNAPTVLDSLATANGRFIENAAAIVPDVNMERTPARDDVFLLEGASGMLQPQTAETFAFGFEINPAEGLRLNIHYYDIDFVELLGAPNPQSAQAVRLNPDKFIFDPTQAELDAFVARVENADQFTNIDIAATGLIIDRTVANSDEARLKGIDFGVNYIHDTSIGTLSYGVTGNYQTDFELTQNGTTLDQLQFETDLFMTGKIGWRRNNVRALLTLNYTGGYDGDEAQLVNQDSVDSFVITDLLIGYEFNDGYSFTDGLSIRLNVDNIFDEEPPVFRQQRSINYDHFTLGTTFKIGITKKF